MNTTPPTHDTHDDSAAWQQWRSAVQLPEVDGAIRSLYARLDAAVQARGPTCWVSGRCCNFEKFGHRLYVTGLEIVWALAQRAADAQRVQPTAESIDLRGPCVFQVDGLCSIHAIRPLGCRIYFCQQGTEGWQHELYETFLAELRTLHDQQALPYRYMEWRAGLHEALAL